VLTRKIHDLGNGHDNNELTQLDNLPFCFSFSYSLTNWVLSRFQLTLGSIK
jgi:hypothetical protein